MATVLRVKRHSNEEPLEALVFACKRRKTSEEDQEEKDSFATVLKFSTTVKAQENDLSLLLPVNEREDVWKSRLSHKVDILKKVREQRKKFSENSRFKVVNCFRQVKAEETGEDDAEKRDVIIFDIESSDRNTKDDIEKSSAEDDHYVYDIYYGQTSSQCDFVTLDHLVDIMPFSSFDLGSNGASDEESLPDDDDDSNDENNWRNDYPDSDHSINEDDMRLALQMDDMKLGNDLSSSDEELIYGLDTDPQDVEYYGEVYAKYKARIRRECNEEVASSDDEDDGGGGDSDENEKPLNDSGGVDSDENEDPVLRFM